MVICALKSLVITIHRRNESDDDNYNDEAVLIIPTPNNVSGMVKISNPNYNSGMGNSPKEPCQQFQRSGANDAETNRPVTTINELFHRNSHACSNRNIGKKHSKVKMNNVENDVQNEVGTFTYGGYPYSAISGSNCDKKNNTFVKDDEKQAILSQIHKGNKTVIVQSVHGKLCKRIRACNRTMLRQHTIRNNGSNRLTMSGDLAKLSHSGTASRVRAKLQRINRGYRRKSDRLFAGSDAAKLEQRRIIDNREKTGQCIFISDGVKPCKQIGKILLIAALFCTFGFATPASCALTIRPHILTGFRHESVDIHCGSSTTLLHGNGKEQRIPVDWEFTGKNGIKYLYLSGILTYKYEDRFSVNTTVAGEYTLHVKNITDDDEGDYRCIDDAGFGPDEASAHLKVTGRQHNDEINTEVNSWGINSLGLLFVCLFILVSCITVMAIIVRCICNQQHANDALNRNPHPV